MTLQYVIQLLSIGCLASSSFGHTKTIELWNAEGDPLEIFIDPSRGFNEVIDSIGDYYGSMEWMAERHNQLDLTLVVSNNKLTVRKKTVERDYYATLTKQEKKDIHDIVTSLASDSLISLGANKSSLKKKGERIEHLHPLKFLEAILTDEKLKAGMHAIRDRGAWIWDEFVGGFIRGFKEETEKQNMKVEYILDFSSKVGINSALIMPSLQAGKWKEMINVLIDTIPRANDPNRYNI
ncbi:MAG: hypothetical protein LW832_02410 [Parachlamydia sp.]|jgi:hypothetical protein|nr:hypothetical protein [Parachlamydia sp.]